MEVRTLTLWFQDLEVLCISQFTLYPTLKGNKPDFHLAMGGDEAR
jgi:D-tyrosyl-tRNA(Tyr) deacylase